MHHRFTPVLIACCAVLLVGASIGGAQGESKGTEIRLKFDPAKPRTGDKLKLHVELSDDIARADLIWFINDEEIQVDHILERSVTLELEYGIKAGDRIVCRLTPIMESLKPGQQASVAIECLNARPFVKIGKPTITGNVYKVKVDAVDPEGGIVNLKLEKAPDGMKLGNDGFIVWEVGADQKGTYKVVVSAVDEQGSQTVVSFNCDVRREIR